MIVFVPLLLGPLHGIVGGCAIPVAWPSVAATRPGAWRPHGERRFAGLNGAVPDDWKVMVAANRGRYATWRYQTITALGWQPLRRINRQGQYRPAGAQTVRPLSQVVAKNDPGWAGRVTCFATKERPWDCTWLARWTKPSKDPGRIVTDRLPAAANVAWSGLRAGIACSDQDRKRGGWHWEQTKMTNPRRAERRWLAMAVTMRWVVRVGGQAEAARPHANRVARPAAHIAHRQARGTPAPRARSWFRCGRLVILAARGLGLPVPTGQLQPEPWPESLDTPVDRPAIARPRQKAA